MVSGINHIEFRLIMQKTKRQRFQGQGKIQGGAFTRAFVIIFQSLSDISEFWSFEKIDYFVWDWNIFTGFSTAVFSSTCTTIVLPIKNELICPVEYRLIKIFNWSVLLEFIIYLNNG